MTSRTSRSRRGIATRAVHGGDTAHTGAVNAPVERSSTFSFDSLAALDAEQAKGAAGAYYQRVGHPTVHACEERIANLEGAGRALLFPSGMAAISALLFARVAAGDHVVAPRQLYGGTIAALRWGEERLGWKVDYVDAHAPESWERSFRRETRLFHVESPTNPTLSVVDLARAAELAHRHGAWLTVDNTVASPVGQRPLEHGADAVVSSATKSMGGHSDLLAGVVSGPVANLEAVYLARKVFGAMPDPDLASRLERSLKTLPLRVAAANRNALALAQRLEAHPAIERVFYPGLERHPGHDVARRQMTLGFGPLLSIAIRGGDAAAVAFVDALRLVRLAASLGSVESLASVPARMSHVQLDAAGLAAAGIPRGLVRLSIGIEDEADLWADLEQALHQAAAVRA